MQCPVCSNELHEISVSGIKVDICKGGCGGIWFDNYEFKKFDENHESAGEKLLNVERGENIKIDYNKKRNCPKCNNILMMRHFYSVKRQVEIDECPGCGGLWLDVGELAKIRSLFKTGNDRNKAAQDYFDEAFDGELAVMKIEDEDKFKDSQMKIMNILSFIYPH